MKVESAIELINQLVFWPGWKLTATDHRNRFEGAILVRVDYRAVETGATNARGGYEKEIDTYATFPVIAEVYDDVLHLYRVILDKLMEIQLHEAREAFRVLPTMWAPFHAHRIDGMKAWQTTTGVACEPDLMSDLQFGIG